MRRKLGWNERLVPVSRARVDGLNSMGIADRVKEMRPLMVWGEMRVLYGKNQYTSFSCGGKYVVASEHTLAWIPPSPSVPSAG